MSKKNIKIRILFPIGAKLVIIISILLLVSLGAVTFLVSYLGSENVQLTAEDNNFTVNYRSGSQAEASFKAIRNSVLFYLEMLSRDSAGLKRDLAMETLFFNNNQSIAAIRIEQSGAAFLIPNEQFLLSNNISHDTLTAYFNAHFSAIPGRLQLFNASPHFHLSLINALFDHQQNESVMVLFTPNDLAESFGAGINTSFLINSSADILLHPDNDLILGGANFSSMPLVAAMQQEGDTIRRQISFTGESGEKYFGAYYHLPEIDAVAITTIPHNIVFETMRSITLQNIFLTMGVLFIAILFIWFFSKTISIPVRILADAALQIEKGDFGIDLKPKYRDELGLLTESFGKMSGALNIFGRFTNKDIAVRAMRGDIKPGGLTKHATIFFSDIRGFTAKSEHFTNAFGDEASNRIVKWLNEYLTRMVDCVEKTNGVVDKFIGDAVMAHWGTAYTAGTPAADAFNGVKASLMMRSALLELNSKRIKNDPGNPEIFIGCGLNTGIVTAGQIGSEQRMEYTVIGDPVNLASRTESLNKALGTDILITENTWELVGEHLITEEMPSVTVKGKEKPIRLFAVINLKGDEGPKTLAELRTLLNIPTPDIKKAATDEKEEKFKIQGN